MYSFFWSCSNNKQKDIETYTTRESIEGLRSNQEANGDSMVLTSISPVSVEEYGEEMILSEEIINPYSLKNMRNAAKSLSIQLNLPQKNIIDNAIYLRVLPADSVEYNQLMKLPFEWFDYPLDRKVIKFGEVYRDPSLPYDAEFTWLYTTVYDSQRTYLLKLHQALPKLRLEVLDLCYIPIETDDVSIISPKADSLSEDEVLLAARASTDSYEYDNLLEIKAFQQAGLFSDDQNKASPLAVAMFWGRKKNPRGVVRVYDNFNYSYVPVKGVKLRVNLLVKWSSTYTDDFGRYTIPKKFRTNPIYTVVFNNKNDFSIYKGLNLFFVARDIKGFKSKNGYDITYSDSHYYWKNATINNVANDYYELCKKNGISLPPRRLKIWEWGKLIGNSAPMLRHLGAISYTAPLEEIIKVLFFGTKKYIRSAIIRDFLPDITINCDNYKTNDIFNTVSHELAHASHFSQVGSEYWASYIWYIVKNIYTNGYGDGSQSDAGICAVGEMWGYAMGNYAERKKYGLEDIPNNGNGWWFKPIVISNLIESNYNNPAILTPSQVASALTNEVKSVESLKNKLVWLYPLKKNQIYEKFSEYDL